MIIDEIKKANVQALKDKDKDARDIYSIVINRHLLATVESRTSGKEVLDADMVKILQKAIKELEEEKENYLKVGNNEKSQTIEYQISLLNKFIPTMLSPEKIKEIIMGLDDKTVPAVMKHFKQNYFGQCDMKVVSDVLKTI